MKKFFALLDDGERSVLVEGDRMEVANPFVCVYTGNKLTALIDQSKILCCYLTETKDGN